MSALPEAPSFGPEADLELESGTPVSPGGSLSAHPGLSKGGEAEVTSSKVQDSEAATGTPREDTGERM